MQLKHLFLVLMILAAIVSCNKDDDGPVILPHEEQLAIDIEIIEDYLAEEGLTAEETASGLHYIIHEDGTGTHPTATSRVEVKYKGYLPDKSVFDETAPAETIKFELNRVIPGWTEGIQLMKAGGGMATLLIPSYLGYGPYPPSSAIPPNSVLIFDVTLLSYE